MTIELTPVGVKCNLSCKYCYQTPMREAGNFAAPFDLKGFQNAINELEGEFSVFGGEPLLTPIHLLEGIFEAGHRRFGRNGIQTNGLLITDELIKMFQRYRVHVGVSIDGRGECNSPRCSSEDTEAILENLVKLREANINTSLIVTIHVDNGRRVADLINFLTWAEGIGIIHVNFHILETESQAIKDDLGLTDMENFEVFRALYEHGKTRPTQYSPFNDIISLLTERKPRANCTWMGCDPITTPAVHGIAPDGSLSNCGRVNKIGIDWRKSKSATTLTRTRIFYRTPWEFGGCKGCDYFFACKGQCPGTAIDGDWRNRTQDCKFWYELIAHIDRDLTNRLSFEERKEAEQSILFAQGNREHGDQPHGDHHGDHTDQARLSAE